MMNTSPRPPTVRDGVTVVIPHYGDPSLAQRLIASLSAHDRDRGVQIVVSDDASPVPFPPTPGVDVVRSVVNAGFGAAVNRGAARATQPWLLILNSDLVADPNFIDGLIAAAAKYQPAICGVAQFVPKLNAWPPPAMRYPTAVSTALLHSSALRPVVRTALGQRLARVARPQDQRTGLVEWVGGAVMLMPTQCFRMVGGFDERYFLYLEEVDLQRRLQAKGIPSVFLKEVEIVHEAGMSSQGVERDFQEWRSRFLYERRWNGVAGETLLWTLMVGIVWIDASVEFVKGRTSRTAIEPSRWRQRLRVLSEARAAARHAWTRPTNRGGVYATA